MFGRKKIKETSEAAQNDLVAADYKERSVLGHIRKEISTYTDVCDNATFVPWLPDAETIYYRLPDSIMEGLITSPQQRNGLAAISHKVAKYVDEKILYVDPKFRGHNCRVYFHSYLDATKTSYVVEFQVEVKR